MRALRLILPLLLVVACGPPAPPRDVNVVIVSFDTLRADRLGAYGNDAWGGSPSPRADALADAGVLFERVYAPRGQTHPSLAAMLTGKYPITTGLRENGFGLSEEHVTLFERLRDAGFQTGAFIANFELANPLDSWVARGADVASDGFAGRREVESRNESRFQSTWDDRVEQASLAFLDGVDRGRPFALWVHFYDAHKPYNPPAEHAGYGARADLPEPLVAPGPDSGGELEQHLARLTLGDRDVPEPELDRIRGLYDGALTATDTRLGRLLDRLDSLGELENTYVVFTSDHGEELYDHNRYFFHGASIYDGVVTIPLIVRGPDLARGLRVTALAQNIDIAPTILELAGLPPAAEMEGRSLASLLRGESTEAPAQFAFVEWQDLIYAVSDGRHKLIFNPNHVHPRKPPYVYPGVPATAGFRVDCLEGYDLQADPLEQVNLLTGFDVAAIGSGEGLPPIYQPHYRALVRWLADPRHRGGFIPSDDPAVAEHLRSLGYVATSTERPDSVRNEPCATR